MDSIAYNRILEPKGMKEPISDLFQLSFGDSEGAEEGKSIGLLSRDLIEKTPTGDIYVFVATTNKIPADDTVCSSTKIVGCIMFTRIIFSDDPQTTAYLLSPVAVHSADQGKGIGQGLITFGLDALRSSTPHNVDIVVTYGDPKYYSKVGFQPVTTDYIPAPFPLSQPQGWQAQSLLTGQTLKQITGTSTCVSAFDKPELW